MNEHPINEMMSNVMKNIREMVDVNTIVGAPITTPDGTTIIPVSKVSFGFGSGGSDLPTKDPDRKFGGGGGAGVTIQPIAFLVESLGSVKVIQIDSNITSLDRVVNMVPELFDRVAGLVKEKSKGKGGSASDPKVTPCGTAETV